MTRRKRESYLGPCDYCGEEIPSHQRGSTFCSDLCAMRADMQDGGTENKDEAPNFPSVLDNEPTEVELW